MLTNPVLRREFLTSLRTPRALALGLVFLTALAGLVMLLWPAGGMYSVAAQNSQKLFIILSTGFLTLVVMVAPSFTASCITGEKERGTYELLYDTLLRPDEIVLGKLAAGLGFVLLLVVASLPMTAACLILGGVSYGDMIKVYLLVVAAAIFFGLLGLYCSAIFHTSYRALIFCYVFTLAICGGTWIPSVVMGSQVQISGLEWLPISDLLHLLRSFSPFAALIAVIHPQTFSAEHPVGTTGLGGVADSPLGFAVLALAGSVLLLVFSLRRIAKPPQPKRHDSGLVEDRSELLKRHVSFPFYLLDPRKRKRQISAFLNVIAVKEMRCKAFGRAVWLIRSIYAGLTVSLILAFLPLTQLAVVGIDTIVFTCISLPLAVIILVGPVLTATGVSEEVESGIFDMLRCTRVGPRALIMGKLEVAWFFTLLLLASTFPTFFVLAYVNSNPTDMEKISEGATLLAGGQFGEAWSALAQADPTFVTAIGRSFVVMAAAMVFTTVIGIVASCFTRRSSTATAVAYGAVLAWAVGSMVPWFIAGSLPQGLVNAALVLNPFAAAANAAGAGRAFASLPPDLWSTHVATLGWLTLVLLGIGLTRVWLMMRPQR